MHPSDLGSEHYQSGNSVLVSQTSKELWREFIKAFFLCERFEPKSHFKSRLSLIVWVNIVLNRTVVVDSD